MTERHDRGGLFQRSLWHVLNVELLAWQKAGAQPCLWWRDDDGFSASPQLERLLRLGVKHDVPVTLAVIPAKLTSDLGACVKEIGGRVSIVQHGVDHINRSGLEERTEFATHMGSAALEDRLRAGWLRLVGLVGQATPVIVPAWNVVTPDLLIASKRAGFVGVSAYGGPSHMAGGLIRIDGHVDILRWKGTPRFKGEKKILWKLVRELRSRRIHRRFLDPIGVLSHHEVMHGEDCWSFLDRLFELTANQVVWIEPWSRIAAAFL